jgi:hydrogenase maturation protease
MRSTLTAPLAQSIGSILGFNQFRADFHYSTHAFSVAEAVELARALGELPPKLVLYGIEGKNFDCGIGLSSEVEKATEEIVRRIEDELCTNFL